MPMLMLSKRVNNFCKKINISFKIWHLTADFSVANCPKGIYDKECSESISLFLV